jgi:hypothetical protein
MTSDPSIEDFAPHVGEAYEIGPEDGSIALILEAATALPGGQRPNGAFRLAFRGPCEPILPQAIYKMRGGGETLEIFIVPVGRDATGTEYEAMFF